MAVKPVRASHTAFVAAVLLKGLDGALELAAGMLLAIRGPWPFYDYVIWTIAPEIANELGERTAEAVQHGAAQIVQASRFAIVYLLAHGILKLAIAVGLLRRGLAIFPVAAAILLGFIVYMAHRASVHMSAWLVAFAAFDALTLALVLNEWRMRARSGETGNTSTSD